MNYYPHYQPQEYDPSSQNQQFYNLSTNDYYSYSNPQYAAIQPYSYQYPSVQPLKHEEQEPNPPGVTLPQPPPEQSQNPYYHYYAHGGGAGVPIVGTQHGGVDVDVPAVHQPIVQPLYRDIGIINVIAPGGEAQTHFDPKPNVSHHPHRINGRGRGRAPHKHAPGQGRKKFGQARPKIQGRPSQSMPQPGAPFSGQMLAPFKGPAQPASVLPPPQIVCCELCRVECDTLEVLEQHMNGNKHKRKLKVFEELQKLNKRVISSQTSTSSDVTSQQILPTQENAVGKPNVEEAVFTPEESTQKSRTNNSEGPGHRLKGKRGGKGSRLRRACDRSKRFTQPHQRKAAIIPLVCELCNVKCESNVVFQSHLVGKKHLIKAKEFMESAKVEGVSQQESVPIIFSASAVVNDESKEGDSEAGVQTNCPTENV